MRRFLLAITLLAMAVPAGADETAAHVTDICGDTDPLVWAGEESVDHPDGRSDGFDIKEASFEDLLEGDEVIGVRVNLELCGDVPDPRAFATAWNVNWRLVDPADAASTCSAAVQMADINTSEGLERVARFQKSCSEPYKDILGRQGSQSYSVFSIDVTSFEVDGSRITWELRRDAFSDEAAQILAPDTLWQQPSANSRDTGASLFANDAGNSGATAGAADRTERGREFVVG